MHMNRRKPAQGEDLADFLSGVVWDAIRDALDAGMPEAEIHALMRYIAAQSDPMMAAREREAAEQNARRLELARGRQVPR